MLCSAPLIDRAILVSISPMTVIWLRRPGAASSGTSLSSAPTGGGRNTEVWQNGTFPCSRISVSACTSSEGSRSRLAASTSTACRSGAMTSHSVSRDRAIRSSTEPKCRR